MAYNIYKWLIKNVEKKDRELLKGVIGFLMEEEKRLQQGFSLLGAVESNLEDFTDRIKRFLPPEEISRGVKKKQLLFVDDEKSWCVFFEETANLLGYDAESTTDPTKAIPLMEKKNPDLMVVDLKMPGLSGMKLIKEIRKRRKTQPLMIITGHPTSTLWEKANKLNVNSILLKPIRIRELRDNLALCLQKEKRLAYPRYKF